MKRITLNIPSEYADVLTITCIGEAGTGTINVKSEAFDLTDIKDAGEFTIRIGGCVNNDD